MRKNLTNQNTITTYTPISDKSNRLASTVIDAPGNSNDHNLSVTYNPLTLRPSSLNDNDLSELLIFDVFGNLIQNGNNTYMAYGIFCKNLGLIQLQFNESISIKYIIVWIIGYILYLSILSGVYFSAKNLKIRMYINMLLLGMIIPAVLNGAIVIFNL